MALDVTAIGQQFWWEFRCPKYGVVTANELHIPVSKRASATPRVSVSRSILALAADHDRANFGRGGQDGHQFGYIDGPTRAIFGRTDAAEPDVLDRAASNEDEAIAARDTLLLTVPNQLGLPKMRMYWRQFSQLSPLL